MSHVVFNLTSKIPERTKSDETSFTKITTTKHKKHTQKKGFYQNWEENGKMGYQIFQEKIEDEGRINQQITSLQMPPEFDLESIALTHMIELMFAIAKVRIFGNGFWCFDESKPQCTLASDQRMPLFRVRQTHAGW